MPEKTTSAASGRTQRKRKKSSSADSSVATPELPERASVTREVETPAIKTYASAVKWLLGRTNIERLRVVKYSEDTFKLDRMRALLEELGNPQEQFRAIHVAGTNGKGSTIAMMSAMLRNCGYAVGEFTSPHMVDVRERISINSTDIPRADFTELMKRVATAAVNIDADPTFFEALTAVGFLHFAEQAVDVGIIECGLGGRLDSTNVIMPVLSVISRIQLDHTKLLGRTCAEIAAEKAGILKPGVPAITLQQDEDVEEVLMQAAEAIGTTLRVVNKDVEFSSRFCSTDELGPHTRVCLYTGTSRLEHLPVPLPGEHQAQNCGVALAAVDHLKSIGFDCPEEVVTAGLSETTIRGRMDLVWKQPRILVDGAHNPEALGALMRCVGSHVPYDSMVCIFGCAQDKDVEGLLDRVNLGADKVIFTSVAGAVRACDPEDLRKRFHERSGKMCQVAPNVKEAIHLATRAVSREDLICVTGSFHLVGETIKYIDSVRKENGEI
ncbi:MAG: bifunctional folylpolyglutamate synthase/dihydrofolate synthase [Phycisphaerales bacterium]|nr:bifunctional folylpolyglutamate synthase/dihydrofolate synthase [Phycisphaerales bacterium]